MLIKTVAELNMDKSISLYLFFEFIGNPITAMFISAFVAYYILGIRRNRMSDLLAQTEGCFHQLQIFY